MKLQRIFFRRRQRVDRGALDRLLTVPLPDEAAAIPFRRSLPLRRATTDLFGHFFFVVTILVTGWVQVGVRPGVVVIAVVGVGLALVFGGAVLGGGLNPDRRIDVSDAGVRITRLFSTIKIQPWDIRAIRVARNLSMVAIDANRGGAILGLEPLDETNRGAVVNALRAHLPPGAVVQPWDPPRINRAVAANSLSVLGTIALIGAIFLEPRGGALGARCSGPSAYLSARFDVPPQPGCVFIRVSGGAKRAGIRRGDQMIAMDGVAVTSGPQFNGLFDAHRGRQFVFRVVRSRTHATEEIRVSLEPSGPLDRPADDPITHFLDAKNDLGKHPDYGIREYSRAIELAPDFDLAYVERAHLYWDQNNIEAAVVDYRKAIELDPELAEGLRDLASLLSSSTDQHQTRESFELVIRAITSDGCNVQVLEHNSDCAHDEAIYAAVVLRLGDPRGALDRANEALRFDPAESDAHATLAWAYGQLGDLDRARAELASYKKSRGAHSDTVRGLETAIATAAQATPVPSE